MTTGARMSGGPQFEKLSLAGLVLVHPVRHGDARGHFTETWRADLWAAAGIAGPFVQDNHSFSSQRGVLRGLHFQRPPAAQAKLVRCTRGAILDVAVDIRAGSATFGEYVAVELSAENGNQLYLPEGFAHGLLTLDENTEVQYKVSDYYSPECDMGIAWNDPDIGIDWPLDGASPILSVKDERMPPLAALPMIFHDQG